ncbi:hypothetical protein HG536_0B05710 [Torulaspora globosa]|uniref:A1 cistron-splicing factor AAR2 n=1 Tax=Torulaspora globosa TaxID=48254 RepID=A0A7G3ZDX0_9SACH|nr:uncharacterized protein HG536_0B05710 [Torulaspora globosa]QLL31706.1 hypothetical protein HG536_0B05710 [Torulaspora globosa]
MGAILFNSDVLKFDVTVGIDQFSFQVKAGSPFCGIKNLPDGLHVIHISSSSNDDGDGIRYGYWFQDSRGLYMRYDEESGMYQMSREPDDAKYERMLQLGSHLMVSFPKLDEANWLELTRFISYEQIETILDARYPYVDSSMTAMEESRVLNKRLRIPNDSTCKHFKYTEIHFKSPDAIRPNHEMQDYMDKSHYLNHVIVARDMRGHINRLLGELQFAFCNAMLFGNYGSSLQWHNIIELISFSSKLSLTFVERFDKVLALQLQTLPPEYTEALMNTEMWERCLTKSYQSNKLELTKKAYESKFDLEEENEEFESVARLETGTLPNIDSDYGDDIDENKPSVASGVYYVRP